MFFPLVGLQSRVYSIKNEFTKQFNCLAISRDDRFEENILRRTVQLRMSRKDMAQMKADDEIVLEVKTTRCEVATQPGDWRSLV